MKANLINSFAAGLLISAGVCGTVYFSQSTTKEQTDQVTAKSIAEEEMKTSLSNAGYVILTKTEWDEQLAVTEKETETKGQQTQKEHTDQDNEKVIYRTVINVASGMTSIEVGNALVQGEIIDNAMTFFNEVEKRGLANDLKPGIFKLDSNMSLDEVINTIFK
ncbi:endolytic transglycosylase MltG [Lysinibacillus sp. SGAir0095]|uniref:endolytic transglycosylase MltG n=1 Tax=Lysinibacillus sp. SGAir0095 TaxID=2070463 RepID=UPI0010CD378D|nr:endolytic transglycosylase MltG [Lysinibacillus sp. SGAir0095]QCR33463.1 hypothetical protein C1N55_15475 [Lysinibacillus sp. SGAir0095]